MTNLQRQLIFSLFSLVNLSAPADMIPMRDFILLEQGMSEAEVLYRIGPYDYETVNTDHHHNIVDKIWYYIPADRGSDKWITEIIIDRNGRIKAMERYRVNR